MSAVSRKVYQKLKEENKRLLKDLHTMVMKSVTYESLQVRMKWKEHFQKEEEFNRMLVIAAKEYLKEHPEFDITKK